MYVFAFKLVLISILLFVLPLSGILLAGLDPDNFLIFPHITKPVQHATFSWPAWISMVIFTSIFIIFYVYILNFHSKRVTVENNIELHGFPWWGYTGIILVIIFWALAWNRFAWFEKFQVYTYTPIWLGYILTINAMTYARQGHCLITRKPVFLCCLFLLSALFWWFYEYINIYIRNWYYVGTEELSDTEIIFHSTIAYATVLPAVISTTEWLNSFPVFNVSFQYRRKININRPLILAMIGIVTGSGIIMVSVINPEIFFPIVWLAPALLVTGIQYSLERTTVFSLLSHGDWRPVLLPPLAALFCGVFWELWNSKSFAHWEYNVPYVDAFHIFEMPFAGYAGYLPFGITCLAVADLLMGTRQLFNGLKQ